jgi:NhaP-type Na+/H+ and K+/H+ antiporter
VVTVIRDGAVLSSPEIDRLRADDVVLVLTPPALSLVVDRFFSRRFKSTAAHLRREHGDFFVDGASSVESLVRAYDLPLEGAASGLTVNGLLKGRIGSTVGRGDRLRVGPVELIVIDMIGRDIKEVGVRLCFEDDQPTDWRRRLRSFLAHGPLGPFVGRLLDRGR